jgi:hypothetical protein
MANKTTIMIQDVGGSFKRFLEQAPEEARMLLNDAVEKTAFSMQQRMKANAPSGPNDPHIKETISYKRTGQKLKGNRFGAEIGLLDGRGGDDAADSRGGSSPATQAEVGLYNEYKPNGQPFMRPAAEAENRDFTRRVTDALKQVERKLSVGGRGL